MDSFRARRGVTLVEALACDGTALLAAAPLSPVSLRNNALSNK